MQGKIRGKDFARSLVSGVQAAKVDTYLDRIDALPESLANRQVLRSNAARKPSWRWLLSRLCPCSSTGTTSGTLQSCARRCTSSRCALTTLVAARCPQTQLSLSTACVARDIFCAVVGQLVYS